MNYRWYNLLILLLLLIVGCQGGDSGFSPLAPNLEEGTLEPRPSVPSPLPPSSGTVGVTTGEATPGGCEVVTIGRKDITFRVEDLTLYLYVPASSTFGSNPYVDVWTENINERKLGRGPANEEFFVSLPGYGEWELQLAVEVVGDGRIFQCDRHRMTVNAKPPSSPPPPSCVPEIDRFTTTTEGEWGECIPIEGQWGDGTRTRFNLNEVFESNSCTEETTLIDEFETQTTEPCFIEPPCDVLNPPDYSDFDFSASFTSFVRTKWTRRNPLRGQVLVHNQGTWVFRLHATSRVSEYERHDPDFTKRVTRFTFEGCSDSEQLLTLSYTWRGHNSRYWYFTLEGPDGTFFKSPRIDGR